MRKIIELSAGAEYVSTADIPELIARALSRDSAERLSAEVAHRKAVIAAIQGGKLKAVSRGACLPANELQADSNVAVAEFARYVAQFHIDVHIPHIPKTEFDEDARQRLANASHWDERELEALCFGMPPEACNDRSVPGEQREEVRKAIREAVQNGGLVAEATGTGNALYGGQWRIERVSAQRWAIGRFPKFPEWLASHDQKEIFAHQDAERRAAGRYTLRGAAEWLAQEAGERVEVMQRKLLDAVQRGLLPVYEPGRNARYEYGLGKDAKEARPYYEEACWDHLNAWLAEHEERISCRFPMPDALRDEIEFTSAFKETVLNGTAINWRYWVQQMPMLTAAQAARLMCALDPDIFENLDNRPNKNDPSGECEKAKQNQRLAEAQGVQSATPEEWLMWADKHGLKVHEGFRIEICAQLKPKPAVSCGARNEASEKPTQGQGNDRKLGAGALQEAEIPTWMEQARVIADELDAVDAKAGAYDSVSNMSDRVAAKMRERSIHGPRGPLSGATIKREALVGGKWKRKRAGK